MRYERREEREFDEWFYSLPSREQDRWRSKDILPYAEQPVAGNVFPVITNHEAWIDDERVTETTRTESTRYIDEEVMRERLIQVFRILDRFADGRMSLHMLFIRTMLGEDTGVNLVQLAKRYRMTKQAMFYRARQLRRALGELAVGKTSPSRTVAGPVAACLRAKNRIKPGKAPKARRKESFNPPPRVSRGRRPR
jgi:hypothetical protein